MLFCPSFLPSQKEALSYLPQNRHNEFYDQPDLQSVPDEHNRAPEWALRCYGGADLMLRQLWLRHSPIPDHQLFLQLGRLPDHIHLF